LVPGSRSYLNEAADARYQAASDRYQAGVQALNRDNSRISAKEAFLHFRRAMNSSPTTAMYGQKWTRLLLCYP
jgi:hypothetical protein